MLTMVSLVIVAIVVIGTTMSDGASSNHTAVYCHTTHHRICQLHSNEHQIYCANDGKKYHGLCAYVLAHCQHNISVVGFGDNCSHIHLTIPTPPPTSHFERGLYGAITNGIDHRLKAVKARNIPATIAKKIYTKQDHAHKVYIRNKDCWAYGLDLTSISPWNSHMANRNVVTLVSPRHALWSRLHSIKLNSTIRFVDQNNNVVERRVIKSKTVTEPNAHGIHDIVVGELDSDVPNTISFSKVMPRNLTRFLVPYNIRIPAMSTDHWEKAVVDDFYFYTSFHAGLHVPLRTSIRHDFYEYKVSSDNGKPTFFVIDNQLVLLFVFTQSGPGGGTSINHYFDQINEIMVKEGGGYELTEIDLSEFLEPGKSLPHLIGK